MNYKIISDGCCDLTKEVIEQYNLHIIPFYISFDEDSIILNKLFNYKIINLMNNIKNHY